MVVFLHDGQNLIKRVIGEPGDVIDIHDGKVFVNDQELDESRYIRVLESTEAPRILTYPFTVPENEYFVMGDNRLNSYDSRYFGSIPRHTIFAKGGFRIYPRNLGPVK
jgi:signal peptidase I